MTSYPSNHLAILGALLGTRGFGCGRQSWVKAYFGDNKAYEGGVGAKAPPIEGDVGAKLLPFPAR